MRTVPEQLRTRYESAGWWRRETLGDLLNRGLAAAPEAEFRVHSQVRPWSGTFGEVELVARRLAAGLRARGVGPGNAVAFQLPNWMEAAATFWAASLLGAVVVPIVHFYGRKEVAHILETVRPAVFVTAERFGRMAFDPAVCAGVPIVGVVGADFETLLADEPLAAPVPADPAGPALIAFTSGTTSVPKGVIHSHQTLGCEARQLAEQNALDQGTHLTATPVGHFIGMIGAFFLPVMRGKPVHLLDVWDPGRALSLMESDGLSIGGGPPYFVTSLLDHPDFAPKHLDHFRHVGLGGSSVPVAVTRRLTDLGLIAFRAYGSTEHPSITSSQFTAPEFERLSTDGRPMPGVEIRLAEDGEILSRGPDLCLGYTDEALTARMFDADGWYHTGDIGVLDPGGCLTVTDRKSDIIIRGGENVSALEVEEVLAGMAEVAEAVVVAVPDDRLGEAVAAVLRIRPGRELPELDAVRARFAAAGVARQKWPERLFQVEDYPRTASGKVRKHLIRERIATSI
ncbi:acyl-CoA synthetase (AMP-forming)/AMP-acid ligase II [Nocardia transvalensis]|uniref:Acyl-CoA synthetase (AMP-forming)/AMP-acid ligase II n=1 Tax=Nocardia transvalensis TaxID=37333 RepID=A0A7W9PG04_9NOCA|nr:AMP-binding protein [Nocardia transvalensis]MBB5915457.1 acyl-CoA synthetase (AMP-forming)/AMP-acid ligase II [Nocardia transvalensis]